MTAIPITALPIEAKVPDSFLFGSSDIRLLNRAGLTERMLDAASDCRTNGARPVPLTIRPLCKRPPVRRVLP